MSLAAEVRGGVEATAGERGRGGGAAYPPFLVWNADGTRAFLLYAADLDVPAGSYRLEASDAFDEGAERPALRRAGSTLPAIARVEFVVP